MKRILSLILCLMMACAAAISFADEPLAPSVKIQRQMQNDGNGIKGSFRIDAEAPDEPLLATIQGAEYDILRNASEDQWHLVVFQQDDQGQQINKTELYQEASGLYLRSDYLPDRVYQIPAVTDFIPASFMGAGENPSIISTVISLASLTNADQGRWDPIVARFSNMLETWLAGYAATPELVRSTDGTTLMKLIYIVPVDDVRKEIIELVKAAAQDTDMINAAGTVMTPEQMAIYINAGLESYYSEVLNGVDLSGELRFEKDVSTLGEMMASELTLPLDPAVTGYRRLDIVNRNGQTGYTLTGDSGMIRLVLPNGLEEITGQAPFEGDAVLVMYNQAKDQQAGNLALRIHIAKSYESRLDEVTERTHEFHHYVINAVRDTAELPEGATEAEIPEFEPITLDADFHFNSKAPQSSPVTVESTVTYTRGTTTMTLSGKVKTAATWAFVPFTVENVKPLSGITPEEITAALAELIQNAAANIRHTELTEGETAE